ncbi:IMP dehydrogenase [candidate division WOR-3 bacterium]|mgnify:CR=1 FL=1|uniref:Inosine-5'-monophosphate dehydrogenase n=1 Tax=candidate division WOR-3 bacterium TaxID=2052148 RepID=A0A660SK29_UNCW3|nr:MAG: IMP dehydrogenase [candidate division WOR-3 bacterium]
MDTRKKNQIPEGLTFDDVLLIPQYSEVLPKDVDLRTKFSRGIDLYIPLVSAAMDTVTGSRMAIAMAENGGIGIIHKNLPPREQAKEVRRVKRAESGMVINPVTIRKDQTVNEARRMMDEHGISGLLIMDDEGRLCGIITKRDVIFEADGSKRVAEVWGDRKLVTAKEGITIDQAKELLKRHRFEKLPVVDKRGNLKGLITFKDITKKLEHPYATVDDLGRLRCGAAVGVGRDAFTRAELLLDEGVDVIVIDTAHAHSKNVIETTKRLKKLDVQLVVGNIGTAEAAKVLVDLDVDGIKVGIGPGSICTTRVIAGIGVPQLTAIISAARVARKAKIPIIADGGIRYSGDVVKALAAGADSVMIGNLFAGTDESPGETIILEGRRYKTYRAMGSVAAMRRGSADRYFQEEAVKFVPEGVEGQVPYRGPVSELIFQIIGGIKSGMGYCGARDLKRLRKRAKFIKITNAGIRESHPHDITITREAPNYELRGRF